MAPIVLTGTPISVNKLYRGRRFLTAEGKAVKEGYMWEVKKQYRKKIRTDDVELTIDFYFSSAKSDIDNALKAVLDSLIGIVYEDDSQIQSILVNKYIDKNRPRTEIEVL